MNLLSKILGTPFERNAKHIVKEVGRVYGPLQDIYMAIVEAAWTCSEGLKPEIKIADDKERRIIEFRIFCQYLYFYMHLTMRTAYSQEMDSKQIETLAKYLGPHIVSTAIDSFFPHMAEDSKGKIEEHFYYELHEVDHEYSASKKFFEGTLEEFLKESGLDDSLLSKLGKKIEDLSGNHNPITRLKIIRSSLDAYEIMKVSYLIGEAKKIMTKEVCEEISENTKRFWDWQRTGIMPDFPHQ